MFSGSETRSSRKRKTDYNGYIGYVYLNLLIPHKLSVHLNGYKTGTAGTARVRSIVPVVPDQRPNGYSVS